MAEPILVTGATGNVGAEVVRLLRQGGHSVRVAVRDVAKAQQRFGPDVEYVPFDWQQPQTFTAAFQGARKLFLVRPPTLSQVRRYMYPGLIVAREAGVEHVVFLSLLGIENNTSLPHYKLETYIRALGFHFTFLRASFFMQNLDTVHREDIQRHDEIFLPAGKGKTSFIDVRDIAAVGVLALTDDMHRDRAYDLTGSDALDYYEVAAIFTNVLGRQIVYRNPSIPAFAFTMLRRGMDLSFVGVMVGIYTIARFGRAARVSPTTAGVLKRLPITVAQYVRDYKDKWV